MAQPRIKPQAVDNTDQQLNDTIVKTDATGKLPAADGSLLTNVTATADSSYDLAAFVPGTVIAPNTELSRITAVRDFTIPANFAGSQTTSRTVTGSVVVYDIKINGVINHAFVYPSGANVGFLSGGATTPTPIVAGDVITIESQATIDVNQEDISFVIRAETT